MTGEKALNNIAVEFDEMGMICSNIAYKDFWEKDLHFKEIFDCEYEIIMKDLKRLKQLEKENLGVKDDNTRLWHSLECANNENAKLKQAVKSWNENGGKLLRENTKLKQALGKACEMLDGDCPVSQELTDDLDCENCNNDCKECWVKFFLNQVLESVGDSDG